MSWLIKIFPNTVKTMRVIISMIKAVLNGINFPLENVFAIPKII